MFKEGNTHGKGRIKGSKNRNSEALRGYLFDMLQENREQLKEDLKSLDPFQRVNTYIQLAKVILPSLKQVDLQADITNDKQTMIDRLLEVPEDRFVNEFNNEIGNE